MINFWYGVVTILVIILSLVNSGLTFHRMIQVSSGHSILDSDAPAGLKLRKWFLLLLGLSSVARAFTTTIELSHFMRGNRIVVPYHPSDIWLMRLFPSLLFLLTFSFFAHYLGHLYYSLQGAEGRSFRTAWLLYTVCLFSTSLVLLIVLTANSSLSIATARQILHVCFLILALHGFSIFMALLYYCTVLWRQLYLSGSLFNQSGKILSRLFLIATSVIASLLGTWTLRLIEYRSYSFDGVDDLSGVQQWVVILCAEQICAFIIILALSNTFASFEGHLRSSLSPGKTQQLPSKSPSSPQILQSTIPVLSSGSIVSYQSIPLGE